MIARLLGATVVLTEQDELLSLLEENLKVNFPGDDGIRWAALDWEREDDTDALLASFRNQQPTSSSSMPYANGGIAVDDERHGASSYARAGRKQGRNEEGETRQDTVDSLCASRQRGEQRQDTPEKVTASSGEEFFENDGYVRFDTIMKISNGAQCSGSGRLDFILCAE